MPSTVVVAVRQAARDGLEAAFAGDPDLEVTYAWPGETQDAQRIFTTFGEGIDHEPASIKPDRQFRDEQATFRVVVEMWLAGEDQETTDLAAVEAGKVVEEFFADNSSPSDVPGLMWWRVSGVQMSGGITGQASICHLIYTVTYRARLT